ncbi:hypothetical protein Tco_1538556 [Tanacetum coccineum]
MLESNETVIPMDPKEQHMKAVKQVLSYVKGTKDYGITYKHNGGNIIQGFSDSSYGVNTQEGKGTTDIIFYYGDSPISWSTQKQATVALSSCESEFIAATAAATQALWLKRLLSRLTHSEEEKITIMVDNKSTIQLMKNPVFHGRSKHSRTKYHCQRKCVERDDNNLRHTVKAFAMRGSGMLFEEEDTTSNRESEILIGYFVVVSTRAGVGPLSGKGPRVIVSADVSILPQPVFIRGGATGAAFKGTNIVKDRAPTISEYNVEHANTLIAQASPFFRFPQEFLCWVGISQMDLNAFIRTADPRKVRIVKRARTENERPIVTVAKHRTVTLLPTSVPRPSGELLDSVEREFGEDVSGSGGKGQENASVGSHANVEPIVPIADDVVAETGSSRVKRSKKKRVICESEDTPAASHPPKKLRADYGKTSGSATGGKSPSVINRLLRDSQLMVEQGVAALPTLPFITSSVTASPLEEGGDHTDSVTGPALRSIGPSKRFVVLSDSSHHSSAKFADAEIDSLIRYVALVMTVATTVTTSVSVAATTTVTPADVGKDKNVPTPSIFAGSSSSEKTDRTLSLFTGRSGSDFVVRDIHTEGAADTGLQEIYVPRWSVTRGFELNDGRSCADMINHFTPPTFFKAVRGIEHEQLFAEFNVSVACNLSLSSEVRMRAEYNILEKRKWKSLAEERNNLLQVKDKEIERLGSQLLRVKDESEEEHISLLEQERNALNLKSISLESTVAEKDRELSDLETSSSSLRVQNQGLVNQVHELEVSSAGLREKLEMYEGSMKQLFYMHFQETFHPHLLNTIAGRRWFLTHGMRLLMAKFLNTTEYMEALRNAFGCAIEKGMQEGLAAGIEHGQAGRCLNDLEAYNPSAEADFNSAIQNLRGLDFPLLQELSAKKDARMTNLRPDVSQLMVPVCRKQDQAVIGSQVLSVALDIYHPLSAEALTILPETPTEPPVTTLTTITLSIVVVHPSFEPSLSVEDYENPDLVGAVPKDVIPEPGSEGKVGGSTGGDANVGDFVFSELENETRNAAL